jgi:hypothetical protein
VGRLQIIARRGRMFGVRGMSSSATTGIVQRGTRELKRRDDEDMVDGVAGR